MCFCLMIKIYFEICLIYGGKQLEAVYFRGDEFCYLPDFRTSSHGKCLGEGLSSTVHSTN